MAVATVDELRVATQELENRREKMKQLEETLAIKDQNLRIAREEGKLMEELHQINQMTKRKLASDTGRQNKMRISQESLDRIIALEDQLKLIDKKKKSLDSEAEVVGNQLKRTEQGIEETKTELDHIKDYTGWDRYNYASRGYVNPDNLFLEHQKKLAALEAEQKNMQLTTETLTNHIEELSRELENRKDLDDKMSEALHYKAGCEEQLVDVHDKISQMKRISQRKEKMLDAKESSDVTDAKKLKQMEGDKRVLHTDLGKAKERARTAEKAILAQDVKLRQLEGRLAAIAAFLQDKFVPEGSAEGDAAEDARKPVPVREFNMLHEDLTQTRVTLDERDKELEAVDATIEQLEKNYAILEAASNSRAAVIAHSRQELLRENLAIDERVADIEEDYNREKERLLNEQQRLRNVLRRMNRVPAE